MRTVVGLYDARRDARETIEALVEAGFPRDRISMATQHKKRKDVEADPARETNAVVLDGLGSLLIGLGTVSIPELGVIAAAGPLAGLLTGGSGESLVSALGALGIPLEEAEIYREAVRRSATLVLVQSEESDVEEARTLMGHYNPIDIERRSAGWRQTGGRESDRKSESEYEREERQQRQSAGDEREVRPQPEATADERQPAKDKQKGVKEAANPGGRHGVRVRTYEISQPIEEKVLLHQEHIDVERIELDRDLEIGDPAFDADGEEVIELLETQEEVIVEKYPRVVGLVRVITDVDGETEIVREVSHRQEVEVERSEGGKDVIIAHESERRDTKRDNPGDFEKYEEAFRRHYRRNLAEQGRDFSFYRPAYIYGCRLAKREAGADNDWSEIEGEARSRWLDANPDIGWAEVDSAVHESYRRCQSSGARSEHRDSEENQA